MKRIDGHDKLTTAEKDERDQRVYDWMRWMRKVRAIERVHEAAQRHGWYTMTRTEIGQAFKMGAYNDNGVLHMPGDGVYKVASGFREDNTVLLRKIESFNRDPGEAEEYFYA